MCVIVWHFWTFLVDLVLAQMKEIMVPMLLMLMLEIILSEATVQMASFRKSRKIENGPAICALDAANETKSPSSLQDCSRDCARDGTCTNFNTKNSDTCDIYNYKPKILVPMPACENYQVSYESYTVSHSHYHLAVVSDWINLVLHYLLKFKKLFRIHFTRTFIIYRNVAILQCVTRRMLNSKHDFHNTDNDHILGGPTKVKPTYIFCL